MTITIPTWLLYRLYAVGGIIAVAAVVFIGMLAIAGWVVGRSFQTRRW